MTTVIKGDSGINLDFSTGGRITGDFSNATAANRVTFQSSTTNGNTIVGALTNGTATTSTFNAYNSSDAANNAYIQLAALSTEARVGSTITGTGSYLPMTFHTGGTESLRLSKDYKTVILAGGSTTANGTGITFPATQSASSDANTLDDYEEGTYTPTLTTSSGTPSYQYQEGRYTKIGRVVVYGGIIGISNSASLTGTINISLPFPAATSSYGEAGGVTADGSGFTWPIVNGYTLPLTIGGGSGVSTATSIIVGPASNAIQYNSSGVANSWYFRFKIVYTESA